MFKNHENIKLALAASTTTSMAATAAATESAPATNMSASSSAGRCWPRNGRGASDRLHALLAAIAVASRCLRTFYANEGAVRFRPADRCGTFNLGGRGSGNTC